MCNRFVSCWVNSWSSHAAHQPEISLDLDSTILHQLLESMLQRICSTHDCTFEGIMSCWHTSTFWRHNLCSWQSDHVCVKVDGQQFLLNSFKRRTLQESCRIVIVDMVIIRKQNFLGLLNTRCVCVMLQIQEKGSSHFEPVVMQTTSWGKHSHSGLTFSVGWQQHWCSVNHWQILPDRKQS